MCFHGTVRYCSLNVHQYKEQGRHDDLWSMLFMLIELVTANLPWKGLNRKESGLKKEVVTDKQLLVVIFLDFVIFSVFVMKQKIYILIYNSVLLDSLHKNYKLINFTKIRLI